MRSINSGLACRPLSAFVVGAALWALCFASSAGAQGIYRSSGAAGTIDAGTAITIRTNENIDANNSDGRIFSGVVAQDVMNRNGNIAIPKGSNVELLVRKVSSTEVALDLDSVMINGERYGLQTQQNIVRSQQKEGFGANKRTGEFVGGGAAIGAIIGAITGGGKGAAIGAGAGAAAGAGVQILTRGSRVNVPAESLLTFRLAQPLRAGVVDDGFTRDGIHYHSQSYPSQGAYNTGREKPGFYNSGRGSITIGRDNNISWQGPENASVYVQVDNETPKLFAAGQSGTQAAPWITQGHIYVFVLRDASGNEVARDEQDLRYLNRRR
jgi:hypothetical protein